MERTRDNAAGIGRAAGAEDSALCALRADFPHFRIWPEVTSAGTLYVARRLRRDIHPHTLVTADLNELRAALSEDPGHQAADEGDRPRAGRGHPQPGCFAGS